VKNLNYDSDDDDCECRHVFMTFTRGKDIYLNLISVTKSQLDEIKINIYMPDVVWRFHYFQF
jgi:hypothetical protein